ncbi:hypothetical protein QC762_0013070 [Podospora pseudocomata]|uniref:Uncharacterized protein n=1 Tax=Podospora pseudocomata TaxID=2093779 RepID=A0ABR0GVT7_9PEZI|nr:hypothetical protein QC762_0013070 [Podospora pseudocomata]
MALMPPRCPAPDLRMDQRAENALLVLIARWDWPFSGTVETSPTAISKHRIFRPQPWVSFGTVSASPTVWFLRRTEVRRMPQCSFGTLDTRQDFSRTAPSHRRMTR